MNTTRLSAILGTGLLACIVALPLFAQSGARPRTADPLAFDAVVRPSEDLELAFSISGRVMEALAEPGDFVQAGSPLLRLDDRDARIRLKLAEIRARSTAALDAAKATLELQRDELETIKRARADDGVNEREVARQQLEVERAEATLLIEQLKREEAELEFEAAAVILEKYTLIAPVSGYVELVISKPGETVEALTPVLRLVAIDPLEIDAAIPADLSMSLRAGSTVWVSLQLPGETVYREASVKSLSQVAEGGTSQRRVRISLPNPDGLPAGILARVRLDKPRDDAMTRAE